MLRELYDEEIDLDLMDEDAATALSELDGRRAMIRLEQLDRDEKRVKATKAAVAAEYDAQLSTIGRERERLRATLRALVFRYGKLQFPDVGTAYKRRTDPKIEIVDAEEFRAELGAMFQKPTFDETAAKAYALDRALDEGVLVPGTELIPAGEDVTVRKA